MNRARGGSYGIGGLALLATLSSCSSSTGELGPPLPSLHFATSAIAPIGGAYEGPAVVERSTERELVLAFDPDPTNGGTLPRHTTIQDVGPALFPVGAKVWLKKDPVAYKTGFFLPAPDTSLSVFTKKDGTLLLGDASASEASGVTAAGLLPLEEKGKTRRPYANECATGTLETTTFEVKADTTVTITDGQTRVARVGGVDYDLGVVARRFDFSSTTCADYVPYGWFQLSVRARDLAALVSTLELGAAPACALGNAKLEDVSVGLYNVASDVTYDGPVFYTKRAIGAVEGYDCFEFRVPGLAAAPGAPPPVVQACATPGILREPAAGEELWATIPSIALATLRKANRGDLVAASIVTSSENVSSSQINQVLGITMDVHPGCAYANYTDSVTGNLVVYNLQEVTFGASPPIVMGNKSHAVVPIGGVDCDVWVWDSGAVAIAAK
jgi:hypothetical protein